MPPNLTVDQWGFVLITWIPNGVEAVVFETMGGSIASSPEKNTINGSNHQSSVVYGHFSTFNHQHDTITANKAG